MLRAMNIPHTQPRQSAGVVEVVDAEDSKSSGPCALASSSLASGTIFNLCFQYVVFTRPQTLVESW